MNDQITCGLQYQIGLKSEQRNNFQIE